MSIDSTAAVPRSIVMVVPAFNEGTVVRGVVDGLVGAGYTVVLVDDASGDSTAQLALEAGATVLRHPVNRGQGAALQTGLAFAASTPCRYVGTFDADGQHDIADIEKLFDALEASGADIALGSRFLGSAIDMPRSRWVLLRLATLFTTLTERVRLTDAHNGLRLMRRACAARLRIRQDRMAHASEIIAQIRELGLTFVEVPVTVRYTDYSMAKGQSGKAWLTILYDLLTGRLG